MKNLKEKRKKKHGKIACLSFLNGKGEMNNFVSIYYINQDWLSYLQKKPTERASAGLIRRWLEKIYMGKSLNTEIIPD